MKTNEIITTIDSSVDEAAMNPSAFATAIEQGHARGVLVGFEFEVCAPEKSLIANSPKPVITKDQVQAWLRYDVLLDLLAIPEIIQQFSQTFKLIDSARSSESLEAVYQEYLRQRVDQARSYYESLNRHIRKILTPIALKQTTKSTKEHPASLKFQLEFAANFGRILLSSHATLVADYGLNLSYTGPKARQIAHNLVRLGAINMSEVMSYWANVSESKLSKKFNSYFDYDPAVVYDMLDLSEHDHSDNDNYEYQNFGDTARMLKPAIAQAMGANVTIFKDYHVRRKNLTDWYIEPDGSLEPNDDDGLAEVVSPPLPAADAIAALKKFYEIAKRLELYTGAENNTGLHINVSIPEKIDILKLAIFLGDEYVLKYFGRLDSGYATSVIKSISTEYASLNDVDWLASPGKEVRQPKNKKSLDFSLLRRLAKEMSRDHSASISNNGKYISFRHAGGDYLNDYQGVVNVVGRFVRAMIIASDPGLYVNEYKTKLAKFVAAAAPAAPNTLIQAIQYVRSQGLPVIQVDFVKTQSASPKLIVQRSLYRHMGKITPIPATSDMRQSILDGFRREDIRQRVLTRPTTDFCSFIVSPVSLEDFNEIKNNSDYTFSDTRATWGSGDHIIGWRQLHQLTLPSNHPLSQEFLKTLLALLTQQRQARR